jgi:cyclophilin family peptidyl-prolyl cis-trans isomerase
MTIGVLVAALIVLAVGWNYFRHMATSMMPNPAADAQNGQLAAVTGSPSPSVSPEASPLASADTPPGAAKQSNQNPDLTVDANGLSKATVVMTTSEGVVKFKFYPNDAPNTVKRIIELVNKVENPNTHAPGFYNGLTFHRVIPGFVVQGGDPLGNGTGGSGVKLKAEFNGRHHVEGAVAMARAQDPDSADSQFYFTLGTFPHLDRSYTIFGQVTEGMDVVKRLKIGDKIVSVVIE